MIQLKHLSLRYDATPLLSDINLTIAQGQWVALLGRSGCGKSTLIKAIAHLDHGAYQQGDIYIEQQAPVAYMAQQDGLLPWLNVLDNVQLAHYLKGTMNAVSRQKALALLQQVGLAEHAQKRPYQLSGGQRQRTALARTLMTEAPIVLMDEPFSAVDAITRWQLQCLAATLLANKTVLLITHDPAEAIRLADVIYILRHQCLSPPFVPEKTRPRLAADEAQPALHAALLEALL